MKRFLVTICVIVLVVAPVAAEGFNSDIHAQLSLIPQGEPSLDDFIGSMTLGLGVEYSKNLIPFVTPGVRIAASYPLVQLKEPILRVYLSGRVFNEIDLKLFRLQPFGEYNIALVRANDESFNGNRIALGVKALINSVGVEYAFVLPGEAVIVSEFGSLPDNFTIFPSTAHHRITFALQLFQ